MPGTRKQRNEIAEIWVGSLDTEWVIRVTLNGAVRLFLRLDGQKESVCLALPLPC